MQSSSQLISPRVVDKFFKFLGLFIIIAFVAPVLYNWNDLTPCFQRQAVVVTISLIYWRFQKFIDPTYFIETFQFFIVFLFAEKLNSLEQDNTATCLQVDSVLTKMIFSVYYIMFSYYIGALLALFTLVLVTIIYHIYYIRYVLPRRRREMSIVGEEFDQLETVKIEFQQPDQEPLTCSICLGDFKEEIVIKLPICNHLFHKECLKQWVENHKECPNCRADIKENRRRLQELKNPELQSESQSNKSKSEDQTVEREGGRRNSVSITVNVHGREGIHIELGSRLLDR